MYYEELDFKFQTTKTVREQLAILAGVGCAANRVIALPLTRFESRQIQPFVPNFWRDHIGYFIEFESERDGLRSTKKQEVFLNDLGIQSCGGYAHVAEEKFLSLIKEKGQILFTFKPFVV